MTLFAVCSKMLHAGLHVCFMSCYVNEKYKVVLPASTTGVCARVHTNQHFFLHVRWGRTRCKNLPATPALSPDVTPLDSERRRAMTGQTCAGCYLYLYSIFSLQLASTHSFHSNGLGGIEDWKRHTGHSASLSPSAGTTCPCKTS